MKKGIRGWVSVARMWKGEKVDVQMLDREEVGGEGEVHNEREGDDGKQTERNKIVRFMLV